MSSSLWRAYFDNDLEKFRGLLGLQQEESTAELVAGSVTATGNTPASLENGSYQRKQSLTSTSGPTNGKSDNRTQLTRAQINSRLPAPPSTSVAAGLNILHHAATSNKLSFVAALLEHPQVDVLLQDYESGWTALHRALYFGNVTAARSIMNHEGGRTGAVKVKDREGSSPFELFGATIQLEEATGSKRIRNFNPVAEDDSDEEETPSTHRGLDVGDFQGEYLGDEVFCWGSNKNLSLGFADGDNRQYPERVYLPPRLDSTSYKGTKGALDALNPVFIQDVQMSKFQTVILTTAASRNLWACGYGHGGRLGLGHESTEFTFKEVLLPTRIKHVALGQDHVLAVAYNGDVHSWGSGRWGQLGYPVKILKNDEEEPQLSPRQVLTNIRKERIKGAAASRWHSVVYTEASLFVFGKNEGQLGLVDSDARTLEFQVSPRKVAVSLFSSEIAMVSATDKATVVLLESHDVWIFTNHEHMRVTFPFERFPNTGIRVTRPTSKHQSRPNFITKITSGGSTLAALSRMGDVFTLSTDKVVRSGPRSGVIAQRIWSLKKRHMAVRDVDVGQDGSVILCTESGSVWERTKRAKAKDIHNLAQIATISGSNMDRAKDYKFSRIPGLTKIVAVRSNAFGAYCALRRDIDVLRKKLYVRKGTLQDDIASLSSFSGAFSSDFDEHKALEREVASKPSPETVLRWFLNDNFAKTAKQAIDDLDMSNYDAHLETTVEGGFPIPVHKFLLSCRSPVLHSLLLQARKRGHAEFNTSVRIIQAHDQKSRIILDSIDLRSLMIFVHYLYTDNLMALWHQFSQSRERLKFFQKLRPELAHLAKTLHIQELESRVSSLQVPRQTLDLDLERAFRNQSYFESGDMVLELKDRSVKVHSSIMCARCPFFHALYRGASGRWLSARTMEHNIDEMQLVKVDLKHMSYEAMELVLLHIYSDKDVGLFDQVQVGEDGVDGFLDVLIDVLSIANELMMERLAEICQRVLGRFVTTRNASGLLMSVGDCSITGFKDVALEYLCLNMETLLENRYLEELDDDMMQELDRVVQNRQLAFMPQSRSGKLLNDLIRRNPCLIEAGERERESCLSVLDSAANHQASIDDESSYKLSSYKGKGEFRPGSFGRIRRKSMRSEDIRAKVASPLLRPSLSGIDMMFDMEEDSILSKGAGTPPARSRIPKMSGLASPALSLSRNSPWLDSRGNQIESIEEDSATVRAVSPETIPTQTLLSRPSTPLAITRSSVSSENVPWHAKSTISSTKLDMKDIMTQASKTRTSNISLGLASPLPLQATKAEGENPILVAYTPPITPKLSQKERRRQQQLQQLQHPLPDILQMPERAPEEVRPSLSPWKTPASGKKVSLKDVLQNSEKSAPTNIKQDEELADVSVSILAANLPLSSKLPKTMDQRPLPLSPKHTRGPIPKVRSVSSTNAPPTKMHPTNSSQAPLSHKQSIPSSPSTPQSRHYTTSGAPSPQSPRPSAHNRRSLPAVAVSRPIALGSPPTNDDFPLLGSYHIEPPLQLSMTDIISQQQLEQDIIKGRIPRQSIEEIQQEQEFLSWWAKEEEKLKAETEAEMHKHDSAQRGRKSKRARGSGGRGRESHEGTHQEKKTTGVAAVSENIKIASVSRGRGRGRGGAMRASVENRA